MQQKNLEGYVGFASLPNQVYRKSVKRGFEFTLMVVGESGLGKSTLINSLFLTDLYSGEYPGPSHRIKKTVQVEQSKVLMKEGGVQLLLTIVDTPGFGDAVDNSNCWQPVIDHIDSKFEDYLNAESRVNRRQMPDSRVHCCLYFIAPSGHGLKPLDIEFMKRLHEKVNIIPLIAKADTLTPEECQQFKKQIMREILEHKIKIYEFPETDDEEENKIVKKIKDRLPLAVVGSNTIIEVNGKKVRGRQYPWGVAEVENGDHCDFTLLRNMLIRTHMQDLKDVTNNVHYENYRSRKLAAVTCNGIDNNKTKGQLTKVDTVEGMSPLAQMEEERREHVTKMKKMEMEMEQVFEMKVKEKVQKLKDSEAEVQTLDGVFVYNPQNHSKSALIVHAFTNKSAFLECLWTWSESLSDLLKYLPSDTEILLLSLDDTALQDAHWMREQVYRAAAHGLHFSPTPVFALGNWLPRVLYSWGCGGHNCGLAQVVFSSPDWSIPVITKRLNARYDWLNGRWGTDPYILLDAGDGCKPVTSVKGAVAWVSEGGCSFFTKMKNMAESNATGVLVYALPGNPIQDMNCIGDDCSTSINIPASMVHFEPSIMQALRFTFNEALQEQLNRPAISVPVFDRHLMQGDTGARVEVDLPGDFMNYDILELDASLSCPGRRDETCAHWDHTVQLYVCCDPTSPYCNLELGRWITAFRRGTGHWLTDVTPLIPLLNDKKCVFTMKTVPWAMPWMTSLNLRFSHSNKTGNYSDGLYPFKVMSLFPGGTFDKDYNSRYQEIKFSVPASTKKVELYAVITAHGSDENFCGEFCVTSHHFLINRSINNTLVFESAGTPLGCAMRVAEGAVPNEHGTWLYGRAGWCDGLQVDPWRTDITSQLDLSGTNSVLYFGLFEGRNPDPKTNPGYIIMYSFLVFYK
ncbi:septin-7 isoform X1 [Labeo rohita]|uniref:Septin-7 n=1 Tax=Labeo rohita TaxID=84645 RepID=A0A498LQD0_LABRO|nr:septin-7 isoform X1 [Labeo rohita]